MGKVTLTLIFLITLFPVTFSKCTDEATDDGKIPANCKEDLQSPTNGTVTYDHDNSTATYMCDTGYVLEGSPSTVYCECQNEQANARKWNDTQTRVCNEINSTSTNTTEISTTGTQTAKPITSTTSTISGSVTTTTSTSTTLTTNTTLAASGVDASNTTTGIQDATQNALPFTDESKGQKKSQPRAVIIAVPVCVVFVVIISVVVVIICRRRKGKADTIKDNEIDNVRKTVDDDIPSCKDSGYSEVELNDKPSLTHANEYNTIEQLNSSQIPLTDCEYNTIGNSSSYKHDDLTYNHIAGQGIGNTGVDYAHVTDSAPVQDGATYSHIADSNLRPSKPVPDMSVDTTYDHLSSTLTMPMKSKKDDNSGEDTDYNHANRWNTGFKKNPNDREMDLYNHTDSSVNTQQNDVPCQQPAETDDKARYDYSVVSKPKVDRHDKTSGLHETNDTAAQADRTYFILEPDNSTTESPIQGHDYFVLEKIA